MSPITWTVHRIQWSSILQKAMAGSPRKTVVIFFDIARGSALECASSLDILVAKKIVTHEKIEVGKEMLASIVSMLVGLIKSNSDRVYSPEIKYEHE